MFPFVPGPALFYQRMLVETCVAVTTALTVGGLHVWANMVMPPKGDDDK